MKLRFDLPTEAQALLALEEGETVVYCVPLDRPAPGRPDAFVSDAWFVVSRQHLWILRDGQCEVKKTIADLKKVKCESQVHGGFLIVTDQEDRETLLARFSMRNIVRVSYAAQGADLFCQGQMDELVESDEPEKYCLKCGRALPGTNECPYCGNKGMTFKRMLRVCKNYKGKFALIAGLMVVNSLVSLFMPKIQQTFIDDKLTTGQGTLLDVGLFVVMMLSCVAVIIVVNSVKYVQCVALGASISTDLRHQMYEKIQMLSLSFIKERKPGELMNRVSRDTAQIRQFMEEVFSGMFSCLITMIGTLICMLRIDVVLTLLTCCLVVFVIVLTRLFWSRIHRIFHKQWVRDDHMRNGLQDVISGIRVVKSFGREKQEAAKFQADVESFCELQKKNEGFWALFFPILTFIMGGGSYIAIFFGGTRVLAGDMTLGVLMQFVTYTGFLYGPLSWMTHMPRAIMQLMTSMNRIYDVMEEQPRITNRQAAKKITIQGRVDFEDVTFGYHSYEPVLEHVDLHVEPGEMIGLVGASGTGKSTLINLIMRLYDVNRGTLRIDGTDIRDIDQDCLHGQIGVVLQETFLFSGTVLDNLRYAKPEATLTEIIMAAKAANAHDFICKLPDGYNTYVGEKGFNISGGERQRIAIARAILNNPRLLILDEATSALDTESEFLIQQAMKRLIHGRTTFSIAHRLSTLKDADRLVVIDGKRIAEVGSHNELMEKKGIYYGLVQAQIEMAKRKE